MPKDLVKASVWFKKAADQGDAYAQTMLNKLNVDSEQVIKPETQEYNKDPLNIRN